MFPLTKPSKNSIYKTSGYDITYSFKAFTGVKYSYVATNCCREYLLSINGLGLKSVECVRLLSLHQIAFPVS